jgi:DNA repair protein RadC
LAIKETLAMKQDKKYKVNVVSLIYKQKYDTTDYPVINNSTTAAEILYESWDKDTIAMEEQTKVLYLNRRNQVIGLYTTGIGGVAGTFMCNTKIFACGLKIVASGIIIAHNHPSGNRMLSEQDKKITKSLKDVGDIIGIKLLDHIIILPNGSYVSLADNAEL